MQACRTRAAQPAAQSVQLVQGFKHASVGMSYSLNKSNYTTGDLKTAADAHTFLLKWFELYPQFQSNPFYISGESYAGIYISTLTDEVVKGIEKGLKPRINLKVIPGYLIGNGATDEDYDFNSFVPFAHGMGLISTDLFEDVNAACHGTFWGKVEDVCQEKIDKVRWELKDLNKYNILAPCYHHPEIQEVVFMNSSLPDKGRVSLASLPICSIHGLPLIALGLLAAGVITVLMSLPTNPKAARDAVTAALVAPMA